MATWVVENPPRIVRLQTVGGGSGQNLTLRLERDDGAPPILDFYSSVQSGGLITSIPTTIIHDEPGPGVTVTYRVYYRAYNDLSFGRRHYFNVFRSHVVVMEVKK